MSQEAGLEKACACGDKEACQILATLAIEATWDSLTDVEAASETDKHPNKMPFRGTLLILDEPSDKPPHGAEGHRILVPASVARRRVDTLIQMGLNYAPTLDQHAPRRKVGVITDAWIEGKKLQVKGFVWKKDFPEAEEDLRKGRLGMSMELADVYVREKDEDVWYLTDFHFTGATALLKKAAAYYNTALAAKAESLGGNEMPENKEKGAAGFDQAELVKAMTAAFAPVVEAISTKLTESLKPVIDGIKAQGDSISSLIETVDASTAATISAGGDEDEDEGEEIEAGFEDFKKKKKDDADDEVEEDDDDEGEEVDAALTPLKKSKKNTLADEDADMEVGKVNENTKNRGKKTSVSAGRSMAAAVDKISRLTAAGAKQLRTIRAQAEKITTLENKVESMDAQMEQYSEKVNRRTITPELSALLEKGNVDVPELIASKGKLSVTQVDNILANSGVDIDPAHRIAFKNQLVQQGLMDEGRVAPRA